MYSLMVSVVVVLGGHGNRCLVVEPVFIAMMVDTNCDHFGDSTGPHLFGDPLIANTVRHVSDETGSV